MENPTYPGPDGVLVRLPDGTTEYVEGGQKLKASVPESFKRELVKQGWKAGKSGSSKSRSKSSRKRASTNATPAAAAPPVEPAATDAGDGTSEGEH